MKLFNKVSQAVRDTIVVFLSVATMILIDIAYWMASEDARAALARKEKTHGR